MAKQSRLPAALIELQRKYPDRVHSLDVERDEWDGPRSPFSYWMWLKPGWSPDGEVHCIHEPSVKEFLKVWRQVGPCKCQQCKTETGC